MKNVDNLLKLALAFCLGGLTDSIIKANKMRKQVVYTFNIRTSNADVYNSMLQYLCTASIAKDVTEQETKLLNPLDESNVYEIHVKSYKKYVIAKIQDKFSKLIGGKDK